MWHRTHSAGWNADGSIVGSFWLVFFFSFRDFLLSREEGGVGPGLREDGKVFLIHENPLSRTMRG